MSFCETAGNVKNRRRLTLEPFLQAQLASEEVADADNWGPGQSLEYGGFSPPNTQEGVSSLSWLLLMFRCIFMCRITQDSSRQQTTDCSWTPLIVYLLLSVGPFLVTRRFRRTIVSYRIDLSTSAPSYSLPPQSTSRTRLHAHNSSTSAGSEKETVRSGIN